MAQEFYNCSYRCRRVQALLAKQGGIRRNTDFPVCLLLLPAVLPMSPTRQLHLETKDKSTRVIQDVQLVDVNR